MRINELLLDQEVEKVYHLDIGTLNFFSNYLVSEINEGVTLGAKNIVKITDLVKNHFDESDIFGYISNRINPYAIIPTDLHLMSNGFKSPPKIAIVNYSQRALQVAGYERKFWPTGVSFFRNLPLAVSWVSNEVSLVKS